MKAGGGGLIPVVEQARSGTTMTETQTAHDPDAGATFARGRKAKIILLSTIAAIAYGVVHDQITARLCLEYFTIGHPPLFQTTSPTILGICWGIAATFGIGALLGVILALVSQSEGLPPVPVMRVCKLILQLLAVMAISASLAGVIGFELSRRSIIGVPADFAELLPPSQQNRFMAVWLAHAASYLVGLAGSAFIILRIWRERGGPRVLSILPKTTGEVMRTMILTAIAALAVWFRFFKS